MRKGHKANQYTFFLENQNPHLYCDVVTVFKSHLDKYDLNPNNNDNCETVIVNT